MHVILKSSLGLGFGYEHFREHNDSVAHACPIHHQTFRDCVGDLTRPFRKYLYHFKAMDHSHHGDMDMGDGDSMMCNMNVRLSGRTDIDLFHLQLTRRSDALHMGHNKPVHRLSQLARHWPSHAYPVPHRHHGADSRVRSRPRSVETIRREATQVR